MTGRLFLLIPLSFLTLAPPAHPQFQSLDETPYFGLSTPTGNDFDEWMLFEARPRLGITTRGWHNLQEAMANRKNNLPKIEVVFDPHIRMFKRNSVPVRMPSYRIYPSYSNLFIWYPEPGQKGIPYHYSSLTLDHGHYSNGQEGCAFDAGSDDQSAACDSAYSQVEASGDYGENLNRRSGEFSTDFTRIKVKHMWVLEYKHKKPKKTLEFTASYTRLVDRLFFFFDVGGYTERDTLFYPMNQYGLEAAWHYYHTEPFLGWVESRYGFEAYLKPSEADRISPFNISIFATALGETLGMGLKLEYGQDTYNVRLVDEIARAMITVIMRIDKIPFELPGAE